MYFCLMKKVIIVFFHLILFAFGGIQREFIFLSDVPTEKITLPNVIIEHNSVKIDCDCELPNWRFIEENNAIYFASEIKAGQEIRIQYSVLYSGISKTYGLNMPVYDSKVESKDFELPSIDSKQFASQRSELNFEGTKTIGVSIGSNGEIAMEQSLKVEILGEIDGNTRISAYIDDQSSSLDGQTSEIGELDKIYLKVENPRWSAIVGDLEIKSKENGILKEFYTPKGFFAELKNAQIGRKNNAFAGISGTKSGYKKFLPAAGLQGGIYNLTGKDGSNVYLITNSVEVLIDGKTLKEDENYIVDYELSSLKFTAKTPIKSGQIIEIYYKYRDFEYNGFLTGTQNRFSLLDSSLNFDISLFFDRDIFESSQRNFTRSELDEIKKSGNNPPLLMLGSKIHKNDVLKEQAFNRIYFLDENGIYRWESNPEDVYFFKDLYSVKFQRLHGGGYDPYYSYERERFLQYGYSKEFLDGVENAASSVLDFIYLYVGAGFGEYSAFGEIAMPAQSVKSEISINYSPSEQLKINITAAGENLDPNSFSEIDDKYNNSAGFDADMFISSALDKNFAVKNEFKASRAGELFVNKILDNYELSRNWGIEDSAKYSLWENMFYVGFQKKLLLKGGYGRANSNVTQVGENVAAAQRISAGFESGKETPFDFNYLYTMRNSETKKDGRIQNAEIGFNLGKNRINLFAREDWFLNAAQNYDGKIEAGISTDNASKKFSSSFVYKEDGVSTQNSHINRKRTLQTLAFSSELNAEFSKNHSLTSAGSFIYEETPQSGGSTFLLSVNDAITSDDYSNGVNSYWDLSSESKNERRWEYIKVPDGTGTHIKDTIFGGFVEKEFGDYAAREIAVSGGDSLSLFVRNNFGVNWYYNTKKGFRFSGILTNDCDVRDEKNGNFLIFLPFAAAINEELRSKISYSMISYNQYLSILPSDFPEIKANIRLGASKNSDAQKDRRLLDGESDFLYMWEKFHLGFSNGEFIEETKGSDGLTLLIKEINVKPLQNFVVRHWFNIFFEETFGWMEKDNSGDYSAIRGGLKFLPKNSGSAEISYTYSYIDFAGELRFNMADGFAVKDNNRISALLGIKANEHLRFSGFVRGDKNRDTAQKWRFSASLNAEIAIN